MFLKNYSSFAGQAIFVACLFCVQVNVYSGLSLLDGTGVEGFVTPSSEVYAPVRQNDTTDQGLFVSVKGDYALSYDYRQSVADTVSETAHLDLWNTSVCAGRQFGHAGYFLALTTRSGSGRHDDRSSRIRETLSLDMKRLGAGGWWGNAFWMLSGELACDMNYAGVVDDPRHYLRHPMLLAASPLLDFRLVAERKLKQGDISVSYVNASPGPLRMAVVNRSGSARRNFMLTVNSATVTAASGLVAGGKRIAATGEWTAFGDNSQHADFGHRYPVGFQGHGSGGTLSIRDLRLPMQPGCSLEVKDIRGEFTGATSAGDGFFTAKKAGVLHIDGYADVKVDPRMTIGAVYSKLYATVDEGMLWLYPFTDWLYLLNIPDAVRFDRAQFDIVEGGVQCRREFRPCKKQRLCADVKVTGCVIRGTAHTAELHRYLEVLPVYRNKKVLEISEKYVIGHAGVSWYVTVAKNECFLKVSQLAPVRLSKRLPDSGGVDDVDPEDRPTVRKRTYGGLQLSMSVTRQW